MSELPRGVRKVGEVGVPTIANPTQIVWAPNGQWLAASDGRSVAISTQGTAGREIDTGTRRIAHLGGINATSTGLVVTRLSIVMVVAPEGRIVRRLLDGKILGGAVWLGEGAVAVSGFDAVYCWDQDRLDVLTAQGSGGLAFDQRSGTLYGSVTSDGAWGLDVHSRRMEWNWLERDTSSYTVVDAPSVSHRSNLVAFPLRDLVVCEATHGGVIHAISGGTSPQFAPLAPALAAKVGASICIWREPTWDLITTIEGARTLAWHPLLPNRVAIAGRTPGLIEYLDLDDDILHGTRVVGVGFDDTRYRNAKVVLVGDSGVGKSGLALALTGQPFAPTESTHGRHVWTMDEHDAPLPSGKPEHREVLLWDLAGQPGYRLVHQLHLDEVAVALVVFDARSETDPFAGVRYWDRALTQAIRVQGTRAPPILKLLVGARTDRGTVGVSRGRIRAVLEEHGFVDYFETSAKEGWDVERLREAILTGIRWDELPGVSSRRHLEGLRHFLLGEVESGAILSTAADLLRKWQLANPTSSATTEDFEASIDGLARRDLLHRLPFGNLVLLQPQVLDAYASALVEAARQEPDGLACVSELDARRGRFRMPEGERIPDADGEGLLLVATVEDLLRREVALREQGDSEAWLVFPTQLTREHPDLPDPVGKAVVITFEGAIPAIYATLVVRLARSGRFRRHQMWRNAVSFHAEDGTECGLAMRELQEGSASLALYNVGTADLLRAAFEGFVLAHLQRRAIPASIKVERVYTCTSCGTVLSDRQVEARKARGLDWLRCPVCDERVSLVPPKFEPDPATVSAMDRAADQGRDRDAARSVIEGKRLTRDFDVFLSYASAGRKAVEAVANQLKELGLLPWFDRWEVAPGTPWRPALEAQLQNVRAAAVFIGPGPAGPWQQREVDALLQAFVRRDAPLIPVLLPGAPDAPDLPPFLAGFHAVDLRTEIEIGLRELRWGITGRRWDG